MKCKITVDAVIPEPDISKLVVLASSINDDLILLYPDVLIERVVLENFPDD